MLFREATAKAQSIIWKRTTLYRVVIVVVVMEIITAATAVVAVVIEVNMFCCLFITCYR